MPEIGYIRRGGTLALVLLALAEAGAQFAAVSLNGSFERLEKDSAILRPAPEARGDITWQRSEDGTTWTDIEAMEEDGNLAFVPLKTAKYRYRLKEGSCELLHSDEATVFSRNTTVEEYLNAEVSVENLLDADVSVRQLYDIGIGASDLLGAGVSMHELESAGIPLVLGDTSFVHVVYDEGTWWMKNGAGEKFIPLGMNHIGPEYRFAEYNKEFWEEEFGTGIIDSSGSVNWPHPGVVKWMEQIAKDHKDHHFNTIAFHHPRSMPDQYWEELEMYYFGKPKLGEINHQYADATDGGFPDVFSLQWQEDSDSYMKDYCATHKDNNFFLGYCFNDLPDYGIHAIRKSGSGFMHHPWIIHIISKPGMTEGKKVWLEILKKNYLSANAAGEQYGVSLQDWDDIAGITEWGMPVSSLEGIRDQDEMNRRITEAWLETHHRLIRKYDPDHLIFGDLIGYGHRRHDWGKPDWIWDVVKKYVDVVMIQSFDFFTPGHENRLKEVYAETGRPVINGNHGYGFVGPEMNGCTGIEVDSLESMGTEYARYLKGIMNMPFMLGWQHSGYMETRSVPGDTTGARQCGFFDPFGVPLTGALDHAALANRRAAVWHAYAGELSCVYSDKNGLEYSDMKDCPCDYPVIYSGDWRGEANARIDSIRKSRLTIKVTDAEGNALDGAVVHMKLKRHKFHFGAVIDRYFMTSPHTQKYRQTFLKYFNASGFHNALKQKHRGTSIEAAAEPALEWMLDHGITMRGHALVWEGEPYMRPEQVAILNSTHLTDKQKGERLVETAEVHFNHSIQKWDVYAWDVINEPMFNHDINDLVSYNTFTYWFKLADSLRQVYGREDVKLYVNDHYVISAIANWAQPFPAKFRAVIDSMLAEGAPVEGIGFQSRIHNGFVSPETMYQRLVDFEKYGLPYQATEFEIWDKENYTYSDSQKKQIVNELLTVYFSHPNVNGIWHWTFVDNSWGTAPWALFRYDGTPYPCGEEWIRLMEEDFNTDVVCMTDSTGTCCVKGFKGLYEITVTYGNTYLSFEVELDDPVTLTRVLDQ